MKFFNAFRTFVIIMFALVISSVLISFFFPTSGKQIEEFKQENSTNEPKTDTWFPIPVSEIETQEKDSKYKYWVVLENGIGFYTNEKMSVGDTGAWINNTDSIVFHNQQKN